MDSTAKSPTEKKPAKPLPSPAKTSNLPTETGGPKGPEPTRYGDWEVNGRVSDF